MNRLIYKSRCTDIITREFLTDILHTSEANNQRQNITGVLLATQTHFLQVIEGRYEDVNQTFMRIARDPRHRDLELIAFSTIDARLLDGWTLKALGLFDFNADLEQRLRSKYGSEEDGLRFPREEWLALALIRDIQLLIELPDWKR